MTGLSLNRNSPVPLRAQVEQLLRDLIRQPLGPDAAALTRCSRARFVDGNWQKEPDKIV